MLLKSCKVKPGTLWMDGRKYPTYKSSLGVVESLTDRFKYKEVTINMVHIKSFKEMYSIAKKKKAWRNKIHPGVKDEVGVYRRYFIT